MELARFPELCFCILSQFAVSHFYYFETPSHWGGKAVSNGIMACARHCANTANVSVRDLRFLSIEF